MPVYEYQCDACSQVFEARQKFSDPAIETCPGCGGGVKKLISRTGFALKGSGWYQQGYSAGGAQAAACPSAGGGGGCAGCPKAAND